MSCVHYKFFSKLSYDTVTFRGSHISLGDLKRQIMSREKLKATSCDLQISNAQSQEEYTDNSYLIPKNSSVIVRRIPVGGVKATSTTCVTGQTEPVSSTSKAIDGSSASVSLAQLIQTADLTQVSASEEDKIKAVMIQSCLQYDPINYVKKPPESYTCFRCGQPGHHIRNCPTSGNRNFEPVPRIKKSTGIPRSFLMEVKDPSTKGAMVTKTGTYVVPVINVEAYAKEKKEEPPFSPEEPSSCSSDDPVHEELLCPICKEIMTDAAVTPCCGNSYCDECIRTALLESEEHTCPTCHQTDVSPDALDANKFLRQAVNNFRNGTGYRTSHFLEEKVKGHPARASATWPASGRSGCELSRSPCRASSSSGSSHTHCESRPGSSGTHACSQLFRRTHSYCSSQSQPYPRRGKEKRHTCRSGSRSRTCHRSRSRSAPNRRSRSRSRSPVRRDQSRTKRAHKKSPQTEPPVKKVKK